MEDLRVRRTAKYDFSAEQEKALILYFDYGVAFTDPRVFTVFPKDDENSMLNKVARAVRHETKAANMSFKEFIKKYKEK